MRILCFMLICAALMNVLPASAEDKADYASDFSAGTDGWYPRSMGGASLDVTEDGALWITGRSADWHSPGRDFPLAAGESTVRPVDPSEDILATLNCLQALGA